MRKLVLAAALVGVAFGAQAQTNKQYPTTPWTGFAPAAVQCGTLIAANFNSTADQPITISVPTRYYMLDSIAVNNASTSMTTAAGGFYTAASKGGSALVANSQAYSALTTGTAGSSGSAMTVTLATAGANNMLAAQTGPGNGGAAAAVNNGIIYFSLTTAQGSAATANIEVKCRPLYGF